MTSPGGDRRHVVLTGAGGFIGSRLAARLIAGPEFADARVTLVDRVLPAAASDARVRAIQGDLCDPAVQRAVLGERVDCCYHLAGILGGAAEADYALSRRVNIDATLALFEALRNPDRPPRVVFASSIAVFGTPKPDRIDDDTPPRPMMTYGAQKLMMEVLLEQFSARGWIDGLALRLPGIVAKPGADASMKSAFLNHIFFDYAAGKDVVMPVSPDGTTWLISVPACIEALVHAGIVAAGRLGRRRALTLPAQNVRIERLVAAIAARFPESRSRVHYDPDPAIEMQFARHPELQTVLADSLGFRHDGDLATLVARAMD